MPFRQQAGVFMSAVFHRSLSLVFHTQEREACTKMDALSLSPHSFGGALQEPGLDTEKQNECVHKDARLPTRLPIQKMCARLSEGLSDCADAQKWDVMGSHVQIVWFSSEHFECFDATRFLSLPASTKPIPSAVFGITTLPQKSGRH